MRRRDCAIGADPTTAAEKHGLRIGTKKRNGPDNMTETDTREDKAMNPIINRDKLPPCFHLTHYPEGREYVSKGSPDEVEDLWERLWQMSEEW